MNGPPALGGASTEGPPGTQHHHEEPPTPRSATIHQHTRDRGGDLSVPVPPETIQKAKKVAPIEDEEPLTEVEKYTIKGLLPIIRQSNTDASMLALGSDLTNLGLKLAADDDRLLSSLWSSPWSDCPNLTTLPEPHWRVPSCYTSDMQGVLPPADLKIGNFAEETLFYIFYTQPRDKMQELAAQELTHRNWRYHKSLGLWLTKEPGIEPQLRTNSMERGTYVFWDSGRWERIKKVFELYYEDLEDRFSGPTASGASSQSQQLSGVAGNGKISQDRNQ
ncbi:CCR4-Not complex subunit not2 [Taphrina deformans PYCC 5710]|uniref:CCR4-Not complex subunit not2 n=1 Tax=Taphrina deformans (strain PYCC 5710 / ATCC 11124 / CBS 356.35 / IMI 108563 / JCM 9778 / NBRC 8474) TaxID=1097556 RepID=R4XJE9_TAPDE|nr:CCR4-Not complex subunit not2 [Taphrina deformans PYCC 5710]|eukprot:CCG83480.1 CCR4-Not complex subunit not2 [Taphrina deformans PYCC 5710]